MAEQNTIETGMATQDINSHDALDAARCISSFLRCATGAWLEEVATNGAPDCFAEALMGMDRCFDLLHDLLDKTQG